MVYYADGGGRDSFIYRHDVSGNYQKIETTNEKTERLNAFWRPKDKRAQLMDAGVVERQKSEPFPSNKALRLYQFEDKKQNEQSVQFIDSSFDKETVFPCQQMTENERSFRTEVLPKVPLRIPGYAGHIPATHEVVGGSVHSDRYIDETSKYPILSQESTGFQTTQRLNESRIREEMDQRNKEHETRKQSTNEEENDEHRDEYISQHTLHKKQLHPVKFVRKPQVEVPITHHISGYGGHQPRSIHTLNCLQKNTKSVAFENTITGK